MGTEVYANGRSIACKACDGKSVAAMPDVCLSPPSPPAGPLPLPYPNTALASDAADGSKTVMIMGKEVMLKDKSVFSKTSGNEAATKSFGMGVVAHQIQGKANFTSWSMDVKFEGENIPRHLDMTLHNEASLPANCPPWPYLKGMSAAGVKACETNKKDEEKACKGLSQRKACKDDKCQKARKCMLLPYKHYNKKTKGYRKTCCKGQTGHHLVEVHGFTKAGKGGRSKPLKAFLGGGKKEKYSQNAAPCVCASSPNSNWEKEHGDLHAVQGLKENKAIAKAVMRNGDPNFAWNYGEARKAGLDSHTATFPDSKCSEKCIAAQLDRYHKDKVGAKDSTPLRTTKYGFGKKKLKYGNVKMDQAKRAQELTAGLPKLRQVRTAMGII